MDIPITTLASSSIAAGATMTSEEFVERSSSWTLACDNALLNRLKDFSETISSQSDGILGDCENLSMQIDLLNSRVQTVTNQFLMLSNTQFTENRVEEFQETLNPQPLISQTAPIKSKAEREAELMSKMKEAIRTGVIVKSKQELTGHDSNEGISSHLSVKLKLPHIIGTSKFFSSRYCGLVDEMSMKPQQQITSHDEIPSANYPNPPEVYITQPEPQSFNDNRPKGTDTFIGEDLFFPSRELYRPPSRDQSLYKEGSPSSDELFIQGASSTATSSTSNIAQDKNYGSDTVFSDKKPKSMMDELNGILSGRPPSPVIGNESEDSDDDFIPQQTGKGLHSGMFADDEDEDIFGENSLFGSKGTQFANNNTFFDKPSVPKDIFSFSNPRPSPPVFFPSEPPTLVGNGNMNQQNSTTTDPQPTVDSRDSKGVTESKTNVLKSSVKSIMTQGLKIGSSSLAPVVNPTDVIPDNKEPLEDHSISKLPSVQSDDRKPSFPPEVKNTTEPLPEFGAKSFVKSMARGLKIDPSMLNPGARPPSSLFRHTSISAPDDDASISNTIVSVSDAASSSTSLTSVSNPIPVTKIVTPKEIDAPESTIQKHIPVSQNPSHKSLVKSIAAGLKIDPMALTPGAKPLLHHRSTSVLSDGISVPHVTEGVRGVAEPVECDKPKITGSPAPDIPEFSSNVNVTSQNIKRGGDSQEQKFQPYLQGPNLKPVSPSPASSRPSSTSSSTNIKSTSIFDEDSSDEDLFKTKPLLGHPTKKAVPTTLFPQESSKVNFTTLKSSTAPSSHPEEIYTPSNSKPPQKKQAAGNKSIFDNSDSEDDLFAFGSKPKGISSSVIGKSSILFVDEGKDDLFGSIKPTPKLNKVEPEKIEGERKETIDDIKPHLPVSVVQGKLVKKKSEDTEERTSVFSTENSEIIPDISEYSNLQPKGQSLTPPPSPLFSNQFNHVLGLDGGDTDIFPSSSKTMEETKSVQNQVPEAAVIPSPVVAGATKKTSNIPKVNSIFDDSDSGDELFKSSSLKTKGLNLKSRSVSNTTSSIPSTKKSIFDDESTDQDIFTSHRNKKKEMSIPDIKNENSNDVQGVSNTGEDVMDGSFKPLLKKSYEDIPNGNDVRTNSTVPEIKAKNFVKSFAQTLEINPLALKPGAKPSTPRNSPLISKSMDSSSIPNFVSKIDKNNDPTSIETDKGFSFDNSLETSSLLPSIAKNRVKIESQKRRPPTRRVIPPKPEVDGNVIDSNSAIPIQETTEVDEVEIPPPIDSLPEENDDGEINVDLGRDSSAED